jgi:membrane protease YdiL (CAAX protease family)
MLGALYLIVVVRHGKPFWRSLGWTLRFPGAWRCVLAAPILMVAVSLLGELFRAPVIPNPWEDLITGRVSRIAVLFFVAIIGPLWEELMFRGFLYSFLEEKTGPWVAIVGAAVPFGIIHGAQNDWQWQYMFLVALSGVAFGFARHQTGSTAAAALMHATYNSALFVVFLVQHL